MIQKGPAFANYSTLYTRIYVESCDYHNAVDETDIGLLFKLQELILPYCSILEFPGGTEQNHDRSLRGLAVFWPRIKPRTFIMRSK